MKVQEDVRVFEPGYQCKTRQATTSEAAEKLDGNKTCQGTTSVVPQTLITEIWASQAAEKLPSQAKNA
ncbi:MAG: hypothetical protein WCF17_14310 [Terracidiphilus sp.]